MKILFFFTLFILSGNAMAKDQRMSPEVFFNKASFENMETVCSEFYHPDVVFEDPLGTVKGLPGLVGYYKNLYENLIEIRFEPLNTFKKGDEEIFVWQMHMRHKKVGNGKLIVLEGVSLFRYQDDKVTFS